MKKILQANPQVIFIELNLGNYKIGPKLDLKKGKNYVFICDLKQKTYTIENYRWFWFKERLKRRFRK